MHRLPEIRKATGFRRTLEQVDDSFSAHRVSLCRLARNRRRRPASKCCSARKSTEIAPSRSAHDAAADYRPGSAKKLEQSDAAAHGLAVRRQPGTVVTRAIARAIGAGSGRGGLRSRVGQGTPAPNSYTRTQTVTACLLTTRVPAGSAHRVSARLPGVLVRVEETSFAEVQPRSTPRLAPRHARLQPVGQTGRNCLRTRCRPWSRMLRALTTELMKSSGATRFTLVAHDWGGVVAWVFAARQPRDADKLVIVNAPHPTVFAKLAARQCRPAARRASTC